MAATRGRKKVTDRLYIQVDDTYCVTVDSYNIILAEIYHSKDGKVLPMGKRYCNTFEYIAVCMESFDISKDSITRFREKTAGATYSRSDKGKLVIDMPEGYLNDPSPLTTQSEDK